MIQRDDNVVTTKHEWMQNTRRHKTDSAEATDLKSVIIVLSMKGNHSHRNTLTQKTNNALCAYVRSSGHDLELWACYYFSLS